MVVNTFELYDILTDIIPGIIGTILLIVLFIPSKALNQGIGVVVGTGGALLIIAVAYVVGRIIRNIRIWKYLLYREEASSPFEDKLNSILNGRSELDDELVSQFGVALREKYNIDVWKPNDIENQEIDEIDERYQSYIFKTVVPVGYSELYHKQTLYQRYTIISSFYESISNLFLLAAIGLLISGLGAEFIGIGYWPTLWTELWNKSFLISSIMIASLSAIGFIGLVQYRVFDRRRAVAFVSDIVKIQTSSQNDS